MKFCANCGHEMRPGARFCPECGAATQKSEQMEEQSDHTTSEEYPETTAADESEESNEPELLSEQNESTESNESEQMEHKEPGVSIESAGEQIPSDSRQNREKPPFFKSKKSKVLTVIAAVFVILLFGSYYTINKVMMSPEAVKDRFMDAVKEKDEIKLRNFINDGQIEMDATKADVKSFLKFLDDRPQMMTAMADKLTEDVQQYDADSDYADAVSGGGETALATLKKDGKKWLLFDRYVVNVMPVYMEVTSTEDDTTIFVGDEEAGSISADKEKKLGPFLPGVYTVKAVVDGDYGKVETDQEADFSEVDEETMNQDFDFTDHYVDLYSDNGDATLYVNDDSTDKKLDDIDTLGPVPKDESVELYAKKKFSTGVKKSDSVTVGKDTYSADLYLDYDDYDEKYDEEQGKAEDEKKKEEALDVVNDHYEAITDEDYKSAYDKFSFEMQDKFNVKQWSDDLEDTIKDDVTLTEVDNMEDDTAKIYLEMKSYDEDDDDSVLVKEWEGYWTLVKENGDWKMDESELDEVDSWTQ